MMPEALALGLPLGLGVVAVVLLMSPAVRVIVSWRERDGKALKLERLKIGGKAWDVVTLADGARVGRPVSSAFPWRYVVTLEDGRTVADVEASSWDNREAMTQQAALLRERRERIAQQARERSKARKAPPGSLSHPE